MSALATKQAVASSERVSRLRDLYRLRDQVQTEIETLETSIAREVQLIKAMRETGARRTRVNAALCGTDSGYYKHIRGEKEPACNACKTAHRMAERARKAARDGKVT